MASRGAISSRSRAAIVRELGPRRDWLPEIDTAEPLHRLLEPHIERGLRPGEPAVRTGDVVRFDQDDAHIAHRGLLDPDGLATDPERAPRLRHLGRARARDL